MLGHSIFQAAGVRLGLWLGGIAVASLASCTTARLELGLEIDSITPAPAESRTRLQSPRDPSMVVLERDHRVWLVGPSGRTRQLTADTTGRYRFAELFARQREGEVILYWAADPMWSPDGRLVSFLTNRESVLDGAPGQSVWTVDVARGVERPLLSTPGRSYRHAGWLGGEMLFFGDMGSGVWAVEPGTGRQRLVSDGFVSATTRDGSAVAITRGDSVVTLTNRGEIALPGPPAGYRYAADAEFSPDGDRLAVLLSDRRGASQVRVFELSSRRSATLAYPDSLWPIHRPIWRDDEHVQLDVQARRPRHPDERQRRGAAQAVIVKVRG